MNKNGLDPAAQKFILHWGKMGARWGINRTVAQIHALLYISKRPLTADEIAERLAVARSNVSTSIKELSAWGLIKVVHNFGDRCDHFHAESDVWEMFRMIVEGRKRREFDPALATLRECMDDTVECDPYTRARLTELHSFLETMTTWYQQIQRIPRGVVMRLVKMGDKVGKALKALE